MEKILNVDYFDLVYTHGALYGEPEIDTLMRKSADSGFTTILWRLSVCGVTAYWSRCRKWFPGHHLENPRAYNMVRILKEFDPLEVAVKAAKRYGLKIYPWITVMDEDYNLGMVSDFVMQNRQFTLVSRDQSRHLLGALCYGYEEVREYALQQVEEVSSSYAVDGLYLCTRSHAKFANTSRELDDFGFNESIVREYARRYGKDILTEEFDKSLWYDLQGEGLTEFFRSASKVLHGRDQQLMIGIYSDGYSLMNISPMAHLKLDWEMWRKEGIVDQLVVAAGEAVLDKHDLWFKEVSRRFRSADGPEVPVYLWFRLWDWRNEYPHLPAPVETKNPELIHETARRYASYFDGYAFHEALNIDHYDLWHWFEDLEGR